MVPAARLEILPGERVGGGVRTRPRRAARSCPPVRRGEGEARHPLRRPARDGHLEKQRRLRQAAETWLAARPELAAAPARLRRDRRPRRPRRTRAAGVRGAVSKFGSVAVTQDELYATLDLDLSWSETALPERERTKHVDRSTRTTGSSSRSSSRFSSTATSRPAGTSSIRSAARDDARAGARVGVRRDRRRHRRVQLPPHAGQDGAVRPRRARGGAARRVRSHREPRAAPRARAAAPLSARLVRAGRGGRALRVPRSDPGVPPRRRAPRDPLARRPLGPARGALRPRGAARAAEGRVLVPQAPPHMPAGGVGASVSSAATRATRSRGSRSSREVRDVEREATVVHGDSREAGSAGRSTPCSPRRRIRA